LFVYGFLGKLTEDRQLIRFVLGSLDDHEYPRAKHSDFHQDRDNLVERRAPSSREAQERTQNPIHNQPRHEQIETLKGVKADLSISAKARRRQNHDRDHPADDRNIAEQRKRTRTDGLQVIGCGLRVGLASSTAGAEYVLIPDVIPALVAVRHIQPSIWIYALP